VHDLALEHLLGSERVRLEVVRRAGIVDVAGIVETVVPDPQDVDHLAALAVAGLIGYAGNWLAAIVRTNAGRTLDSPALVADGNHAKADAYVSLAVVASAAAVAVGLQLADPLIGLGISILIMRITWQSWRTVRDGHAHAH